MKCLYAKQMREADQAAIELGIPALVLMENAGRSVFREISKRWGKDETDRIIVVAGKGNNGGDGFVVARHLWNAGYDVSVYLIGRPEDVQDHARINLDAIRNMGLPVTSVTGDLQPLREEMASRRVNLCVDALLGTGLSREVRDLTQQVIECINDNDIPVVAVDIPSGLNADSGLPMGAAVRAGLTVSFAYPKVGLVVASGSRYTGELIVSDISIPKTVEKDTWQVNLLDSSILENIPSRPPEAHKGDYGRIAVFAGSAGLTGAAALTSLAAVRSGAGLVTLGIPAGLNSIMEVKLTEVMTSPMGEAEDCCFKPAMLPAATELAQKSNAVILGPGMGTAAETAEFVQDLAACGSRPLVVDADALNIIAPIDMKFNNPCVMTPHPGEMARLLNIPGADIQKDRIGAALRCAAQYNAVTVLKGFRTVIASPEGDVAINPTGSNNMASGGMGDVLPGLIGTFLAGGLATFDAACLGVYMHGLASDRISATMGKGQIASDIIEQIPYLMKEYCETSTDK